VFGEQQDRALSDQSPTPRSSIDKHVLWFVVSASCIFTALIIVQSLGYGRLSLPATYDDVVYFNDAAHRLQTLHDHGFVPFFTNLFRYPPHSPFATLVPLIGFALFGMKDWAPAAVNVVWVALLLVYVRLLLPREIPFWGYVAVALATLSWPLTGAMVIECRPDFYTALLTVMGITLMLRWPFLHAPARHSALAAAIFGAALLAKPSISPVTILAYGASLVVAVLLEIRGRLDRKFLAAAARRLSMCLAITFAAAVPYFAFAWRDVYVYIVTVMWGSQKDIWHTNESAFRAAIYYLWGEGGQATMGIWSLVTVVLVAIVLASRLAMRQSVDRRAIGLAVVFAFAYLLVTIPSMRSPETGVVVSLFYLSFFALACGRIIAWLTTAKSYGQWIATGFCGALCITALSVASLMVDWPYSALPTNSYVSAVRNWDAIRRVADYFASRSKLQTHVMIFFPAITQYVNADTLDFELYKRGVKNVETVSHIYSPEDYRWTLERTNFVVLFDEDDPDVLSFLLPDRSLFYRVRETVTSDPSFEEGFKYVSTTGHAIRIFARKGAPMSFRGTSPMLAPLHARSLDDEGCIRENCAIPTKLSLFSTR
jgi:hypothetical protein